MSPSFRFASGNGYCEPALPSGLITISQYNDAPAADCWAGAAAEMAARTTAAMKIAGFITTSKSSPQSSPSAQRRALAGPWNSPHERDARAYITLAALVRAGDRFAGFAVGGAAAFGFPLVPKLFAFGQSEFDFYPAILEIKARGDQGEPLLLGLADQ